MAARPTRISAGAWCPTLLSLTNCVEKLHLDNITMGTSRCRSPTAGAGVMQGGSDESIGRGGARLRKKPSLPSPFPFDRMVQAVSPWAVACGPKSPSK